MGPVGTLRAQPRRLDTQLLGRGPWTAPPWKPPPQKKTANRDAGIPKNMRVKVLGMTGDMPNLVGKTTSKLTHECTRAGTFAGKFAVKRVKSHVNFYPQTYPRGYIRG